ncbi:potassium channel family protein [Thermodesulfobacteriota bacterium]
MYIVIGGGGVSGWMLAESLQERKHDVVVIEKDKDICEKIYAELGVVTVHGSSVDISVLEEAGIGKADIAIGTMYEDEANLTFAILAKSYNVPKIMVKMRRPEYERVFAVAGATSISNVTELFVRHMMMEIENPNVRIITPLERGKAELIMIRIPDNSALSGKTINEIVKSYDFPKDSVFAGILNEKSETITIPRGNHVINEGDKVFIVCQRESFSEISEILTMVKA